MLIRPPIEFIIRKTRLPTWMELDQSPRKIRLFELLLVTSVAFAGPVYGSFYYFFGGLAVRPTAGQHIYSLITELLGLSVLVYVLFRQGRHVSDIGFGFNWRDIPRSLAVATIGYVAFYVCFLAVYYAWFALTGSVLTAPELGDKVFGARFHWAALILALINPFFEELIVRAYLMTEVKFLTGNAALSIAASVGLQTLYHLYQGMLLATAEAALFLVFALYFNRSRKIMPVVLAHLLFDVSSWLYYGLAGVN